MEKDFKILIHRNNDNLHVRLEGLFNKNAARKLIGLLESYARKFSTVFLHTSGLHEVVPSSLVACRAAMLRLQRGSTIFTATGEYAPRFVPESKDQNSIGAPPNNPDRVANM